MSETEKMCDLIYETLRANNLPVGNRAFIADVVSEALYKEGYHKLPTKPPLLSNDEMSLVKGLLYASYGEEEFIQRTLVSKQEFQNELDNRLQVKTAQAQWDIWNKAIYGEE